MRLCRRSICLVITVAAVVGSAGACRRTSTSAVTIRNVKVVDIAAGTVGPPATVIVRGGWIDRIDSNGIDSRVGTVVDGSGGFLIPGLWDMHVHLSAVTADSLPLLIANGVLGVRDMGSDLAEVRRWRTQIESGGLVGPHIITAGPKLDGEGGSLLYYTVIRTPEEARAVVDDLAAAGVDFIKVHAALDRARFVAVAEQSRAHGLRFAGHLPDDVPPTDAARMGIASIEHFSGFSRPCSGDLLRLLASDQWASLRKKCAPEGDLDATLAVIRDAGTWVTPTLVSFERIRDLLDSRQDLHPDWRYVVPALRRSWDASGRAIVADLRATPESAQVWRRVLEAYGPLTAQAHRSGVRLLAGTDLGNPMVSPGFDLHEELALLVGAGLTPAAALQSATVGPAAFLRSRRRSGSISSGQPADVVLLDANPLDDIRNTRRIRAVVADGKLFDRAALNALLDAAARLASSQ